MADADDRIQKKTPEDQKAPEADFHDHKDSAPKESEKTSGTAAAKDVHESHEEEHDSCAEKLRSDIGDHDHIPKEKKDAKPSSHLEKQILSLSPIDLNHLTIGDTRLEKGIAKAASTAVLDRNFDALGIKGGMDAFKNAGKEQSYIFGSTFNNTSFGDIFSPNQTRKVESFDAFHGMPNTGIFDSAQVRLLDFSVGNKVGADLNQFKFDGNFLSPGGLHIGGENVLGSRSLSFEGNKLDLGSSVMTSFFTDATNDIRKDQGEKPGFWHNVFNKVGEKASSALKGAIDFVGTGIENASVDWSGLKLGNKEVHDTPGGKVTTEANAENKSFDTGHAKILQSRDSNGQHEIKLSSDSGAQFKQDRDGKKIASSDSSDIVVKVDSQTGKVEAFDKSGKEIAKFNNRGDAIRFLDTADKVVVQPGQTLEQAFEEYKKDPTQEARLKTRPIILMDGKGESMTVQPDGSRLYNHANGESYAIYKHTGPDGKPHDIRVDISKDKAGDDIFTILGEKGEKLSLDSDAAKRLMTNSRLRMENNQLMVNEDISGRPDAARWRRIMENRRLYAAENIQIDRNTNAVLIQDKDQLSVSTPNATTGEVVEQNFKRQQDGSFNKNPFSVTTISADGKATIQGMDPETGTVKTNDVVTIDSKKGVVDAFNHVHMGPDESYVINADGSKTIIDRHGDINALDKHGNTIVQTKGDGVSYDGGNTYERYSTSGKAYTEEQAQKITADASAAATKVLSSGASLLGSLVLNAGQIEALAGELGAAISKCLALGIPVPADVAAAQGTISTLRGKLVENTSVASKLGAIAGQGANGALIADATHESGSYEQRAKSALRHAGILPDDNK